MRIDLLSLRYCELFFFENKDQIVPLLLNVYVSICLHSLFLRFRPRILIDVSKIDMTTTVLGFNISMPIMIAPTAFQKMAHPEGMESVSFCYLVLVSWKPI